MTFATHPVSPSKASRNKKYNYPFAELYHDPSKAFTIPASLNEAFSNCRVHASKFNKKFGCKIECNVQVDGSMRVSIKQPKVDMVLVEAAQETVKDTTPVFTEPITVVEPDFDIIPTSTPVPVKPVPVEQVPNRAQFNEYLLTLAPGTSIILKQEYIHRFAEFELWAMELDFDTKVTYNPPELKITRKATTE